MTKQQNEGEVIEVKFHEISSANGLFCQFDDYHGVLFLDVKNSFTQEDFALISSIIDPYFQDKGELKGVIINSKKFPYWSDSQNRLQYIEFAANNHHKFKKAALSMNGIFTKIVARIAKGRAHPEVKVFKYGQVEQAQDWIIQ